MGSSKEFVEYVVDQIAGTGDIRYKKMFGEYSVYVNDKPVLLVCDDVVYVKMRDEIAAEMSGADIGNPYDGAKPHYILDIDDQVLSRDIVSIMEPITPIPKPKKPKE